MVSYRYTVILLIILLSMSLSRLTTTFTKPLKRPLATVALSLGIALSNSTQSCSQHNTTQETTTKHTEHTDPTMHAISYRFQDNNAPDLYLKDMPMTAMEDMIVHNPEVGIRNINGVIYYVRAIPDGAGDLNWLLYRTTLSAEHVERLDETNSYYFRDKEHIYVIDHRGISQFIGIDPTQARVVNNTILTDGTYLFYKSSLDQPPQLISWEELKEIIPEVTQ